MGHAGNTKGGEARVSSGKELGKGWNERFSLACVYGATCCTGQVNEWKKMRLLVISLRGRGRYLVGFGHDVDRDLAIIWSAVVVI